jgi:hypothetical protein
MNTNEVWKKGKTLNNLNMDVNNIASPDTTPPSRPAECISLYYICKQQYQ